MWGLIAQGVRCSGNYTLQHQSSMPWITQRPSCTSWITQVVYDAQLRGLSCVSQLHNLSEKFLHLISDLIKSHFMASSLFKVLKSVPQKKRIRHTAVTSSLCLIRMKGKHFLKCFYIFWFPHDWCQWKISCDTVCWQRRCCKIKHQMLSNNDKRRSNPGQIYCKCWPNIAAELRLLTY